MPPSMLLRAATPEDIPTIFTIRCAVRENHLSVAELAARDITPQSVAAMMASGDFLTLLAEVDGQPQGFVMAQYSKAYVFALFVRPEAEGLGVGRALLTAVERDMARAGVEALSLVTGGEPGLRSQGFYRHLGWREDGVQPDGQIRFVKQRV